MNRKSLIIFNWLGLVILIFATVAARFFAWNAYQDNNRVQVNLFLPSGYAFGIWNFICLLLVGFVMRSTDLLDNRRKAQSGLGTLAKQVSPYFQVCAVLTAGWMLSWHYETPYLAVILISLLFLCLLRIFFYIQYSAAPLTYLEHVTLETPFVVFFSWVTFLYISNIASVVLMAGWSGEPLKPATWCCILISLSTVIAVWLSKKRPAYCMVCIWVIVGIYTRRAGVYPLIGYFAMASCAVCLVASALGFWSRRKVLFGN